MAQDERQDEGQGEPRYEPPELAGPGTRRAFLGGTVGAGLFTAAVAGYGLHQQREHQPAAATAAEQQLAGHLPAVPFHGPHQPGILPAALPATAVISFDVTAASKAELTDLMRTITDRARFLTRGGVPEPVGIADAPSDSGVLGPVIVPDGLTVTLGVGASLFDERFGLSSLKPAKLATMTPFPDDSLDEAQCHGDLSMQLSAGHTDVIAHALRDIAKNTRGAMAVRWRIDGFVSPPRPACTPRNLLGFMDGIANPSTASKGQMDKLVWVGKGGDEPGPLAAATWSSG